MTTVGTTEVKVIVGSPLPYAQHVHEGTGIYGPHGTPIVPKNAKALKFEVRNVSAKTGKKTKGSKWVFAKSVAGQKPNPFLTRAIVFVMGTSVVRRTP